MIDLDEQARTILKKNDRGGFTIPTARLYPFQWNWDSAFIAIGIATMDSERAWRELEMLVEGQAYDGMIPSIIFRNDDEDYFPGPKIWQTNNGPIDGTGISQPPVLASVVAQFAKEQGQKGLDRARNLFPQMMKWHHWWHDYRTPDGQDVVCTVHPWETGRDNCPDWKIGLGNMQTDPDLEPYQRKDIEHADPAERPSQEEYDKYISIVKFGRDHDWDQKTLTNQGPFLMADPGIFFILLRADRDLLWLAEQFGFTKQAEIIKKWIAKAEVAAHQFWNEDYSAFCAWDVHTGEFSNGFSNASALCFYAGIGTDEQRAKTILHMERIASQTQFGQSSWDPDAPLFESQRYWCGPLWCQMNYMIAKGLAEQGYDDLAHKMRSDLKQVIELSGFYECFDPLSGAGCIGRDFSWTAALWLAWASPSFSNSSPA
ncbi:MAG: MGH1-like glycoside hydrolase domain-containing protein [Candidatus Puniceispirillaceae bacterium]